MKRKMTKKVVEIQKKKNNDLRRLWTISIPALYKAFESLGKK